jgi:uncharacterized protein YutD
MGESMDILTVEEVETTHAQLVEHLADRFDPEEAVNRATTILTKYYLGVEQ